MIGKLFSSAALALTLGLTSAPLLAQNVHFVSASASISSTGALVVSFKEAGLGNNEYIHYTLTAQIGSATYACINGGGNHPSASNKETVTAPVSASGEYHSGKNGQISQSLTAGPADPGDFACPGTQTLVLASVSYTGIQLTDDTTQGIAPVLLDDISYSFCNPDNLTKATYKNCAVVQ